MTREIYPDGTIKVMLDQQDINQAIENHVRAMNPLITQTWTIAAIDARIVCVATPPKDAKP